jgi:hypothetical protein
VLEHEGVVVARQQRVDRHRHQAGVERAEEGGDEVDAVVHHHQHALFAAQPEREQAGGAAAHPLAELGVAQALGVIDVGELGRALRVQREQPGRGVEALGRRLGE